MRTKFTSQFHPAYPSSPAERQEPRTVNGSSNGSETASASAEELKHQIKSLRAYIADGLRQKVEKQVLDDLSGHSTISYIKKIEGDRTRYRDQMLKSAEALRQLRISHRATLRMLEAKKRKRKPKQGNAKRPAKASV